jgi:hypothetical protein
MAHPMVRLTKEERGCARAAHDEKYQPARVIVSLCTDNKTDWKSIPIAMNKQEVLYLHDVQRR